MRYLIHIFKTRAVFIVLAALVVIVGFLFFWARGRRTEPSALPLIPAPPISYQTIAVEPQVTEIKDKLDKLPKKLMVFQIDSPKISQDQALAVANNFGFKNPPQISQDIELGPVYNWSSAENYLSIILNQGSISYGIDLLNNPGILKGNLPPLEEVKTAALSFLENKMIPLPEDIKPTIKQTQYLRKSGPIYQTVVSEKNAEVIQIDFEFKINETKILPPTPETTLLTLKIGPETKIISLDYQPPLSKLTNFHSYPLKTKDQILEEIKAKPRISHLQSQSYQYLITKEDYQKIKLIEFEEIELGYYQPPLPETYLQPVWLISGKAQLSDGKIGTAFLYLPAIEDKYFISVTPEP